MLKRFFQYLRRHWHKLIQLHDTPHSIAGGVAIGIYVGFFPPLGFKVITAILIAWIFRCSRVAAAVAVNWHDITWIITPLFFILLRAEYSLGYWICSDFQSWPQKVRMGDFKFEHWLHWKVIIRTLWPTCVGSAVIALPFSLLVFFITLKIVERHQKKKKMAGNAGINLDDQKQQDPE